MNKTEIINELANLTNKSKKTAKLFLDSFVFLVRDATLKGNKITIKNFGSFKLKQRSERSYKNPITNKSSVCTPRKVIAFKSSKHLI